MCLCRLKSVQVFPGRRRIELGADITVRRACVEDADEILVIETSCFTLPHTREQLLREIAAEHRIILAAEKNGMVVGFVTLQYIVDEGYIGDVAVAESFRRRGIADLLLQKLRQEGLSKKLSFLTLEVRASNAPAIALYEKNGYRKISVMKDYYTLPKEDALIMTLYL